MPKVTMVTAVRDGERFVAGAIASVLNQTFTDFELLVIDDASTDGTGALVQGLRDRRLTYVANDRNLGLACSLNIGLQHATGEYIARLDHDDVSRPDRLARQVEVLDREPATAVVGSLARLIDVDGVVRGLVERPVSGPGIRWMSLLENPLIHSSTMFRASVARDLGGYRDDVPFAEDYDLWARMLERHDARNIAEPLIDYRHSETSIMSSAEHDLSDRRRRRDGHAAIVSRRVEHELQTPCSAADAHVLAGVAVGLAPSEIDPFLVSYDAMSDRFEARMVEAVTTPDYWRTRARQLDAAAHRLSPPSRRGAMRLYLHALRRNPNLAAHLSWSRMAAATVLGRHRRDRVRHLLRAAR